MDFTSKIFEQIENFNRSNNPNCSKFNDSKITIKELENIISEYQYMLNHFNLKCLKLILELNREIYVFVEKIQEKKEKRQDILINIDNLRKGLDSLKHILKISFYHLKETIDKHMFFSNYNWCFILHTDINSIELRQDSNKLRYIAYLLSVEDIELNKNFKNLYYKEIKEDIKLIYILSSPIGENVDLHRNVWFFDEKTADEFLDDKILSLNIASIGTIHSICSHFTSRIEMFNPYKEIKNKETIEKILENELKTKDFDVISQSKRIGTRDIPDNLVIFQFSQNPMILQ